MTQYERVVTLVREYVEDAGIDIIQMLIDATTCTGGFEPWLRYRKETSGFNDDWACDLLQNERAALVTFLTTIPSPPMVLGL